MAIRTLMLRKKLNDANKQLNELREAAVALELRKADLVTREEELEKAVGEASTDEEQAVVEESVNQYEADTAALENEISENGQKISDLEGEVSEMERQLSEMEEDQKRTVPPIPTQEGETKPKKTKKRGGLTGMIRSKSLRQLSIQERSDLIDSEEIQNLLAEVRACAKDHKRAISGGAYTIGEQLIGLLREDVIDYSKLYRRVNVARLSGKGREIVMGTFPEGIWEECCDPINELDQAFTAVELDCYKVAGYFAVCNALIEDSDIGLLDNLMVALNASIGLALDKAILYGTGVKMPTGVVTAIAASQTLKVSNEVTISSANSTGIKLFQELIKAGGKTANRYARGEKTWVMAETTYTTLLAESLAVNAAGALVAGFEDRMPVAGGALVVLNFVPDNNIVAGYFDLYTLGERKGFTIDTSEHVKFIEDQTVIRGRARYDGKPAIPAAFVAIGINNTTPSESIDFANPLNS